MLKDLKTWFDSNMLFLNLNKTGFMHFQCSRKKIIDALKINFQSPELSNWQSTKCLGVIFDEYFTWIPHCK